MQDSINANMQAELSTAFDDAMAAETASESTPEIVAPAPVAEAPASATPEATPEATSTEPPDLPDETPVKVMVDGQPVTMTWGDAKKGIMLHKAFTQKTQTLAQEREQVRAQQAEAERWRIAGQTEIQRARQLEADLKAMVQDPNKLAALYLAATGQQSAAPAQGANPQPQQMFDPDQFRQELLSELAPAVHGYIEQQHAQIAQANEVQSYTESLIADSAVLKALGPDYLEQVYAKVFTMKPTSPEEALEYIRLEIEASKQAIAAATGETAKAAAIAKHKALTGTERGGSPITPVRVEPETFDDVHKQMSDWLDTQPAA